MSAESSNAVADLIRGMIPPPRIVEPIAGPAVPVEYLENFSHLESLVDSSLPVEGFVLTLSSDGLQARVADDAGLRQARSRITSLIRSARRLGVGVPAMRITDHPEFPVRSVMLDVSRDKVPTLATLFDLVERLAEWGYNQLQLYIEHTFAYSGHEVVWRDATPYTVDDVRVLDAHCRGLGVELVLQQNCLGHMERWLCHEPYAELAAIPGGWRSADGEGEPPTTIDPTNPASFALVRDLVEQLIAALPEARRVHLGLDEPLDLSPEVWEAIYADDVPDPDVPPPVFTVTLPQQAQEAFADWLSKLRELPVLEGREVLVWGDVMAANEYVLKRVPDGVTVVDWGYEAWYPFEARAKALAAQGIRFWLCAGTSAWGAVVPRYRNVRGNAAAAASAGVAHGGQGFVMADWGDLGHFSRLALSEPAFALGAAYAWNPEGAADWDWATAIDRHVFETTDGFGESLLAAGDRHEMLRPSVPEASVLGILLRSPEALPRLREHGLTRDALVGVMSSLASIDDSFLGRTSARVDGALVIQEVRASLAWLMYGCRVALAQWDGPMNESDRQALIAEHGHLLALHEEHWLARNRSGGLSDSSTRVREWAPASE